VISLPYGVGHDLLMAQTVHGNPLLGGMNERSRAQAPAAQQAATHASLVVAKGFAVSPKHSMSGVATAKVAAPHVAALRAAPVQPLPLSTHCEAGAWPSQHETPPVPEKHGALGAHHCQTPHASAPAAQHAAWHASREVAEGCALRPWHSMLGVFAGKLALPHACARAAAGESSASDSDSKIAAEEAGAIWFATRRGLCCDGEHRARVVAERAQSGTFGQGTMWCYP
jgi:hypothetical protein